MSRIQQYYDRFSLSQRLQHWLMVVSFTVLAVTGLPQKFVGMAWAESIIAALGGIETVRIWHRYAAIVLMLVSIYHGGELTYKLLVQRVGLSMMFGWQDVKDLFGVMAYNLGLRRERPKLPRYNFEEKMEYWSLVWGTVLMIMTGFMLWNPIATTRFLPGSFIPAAKAAHGAEAILAVLAIFVWHMYGVHLRKFNLSMFTGKLSREEMEHEHALELEAIESGAVQPVEDPAAVARRARAFIPLAVVIASVLLFGLYLFVTFEQTAIETVAAAEAEPADVYQPLEITFTPGGLHATIAEFNGPENCAASGCHDGGPLETAARSAHSQRIAVAGPNPLLAHLVAETTPTGDTTPDCLLCHARDYQLDDPLASARSAGPAGGQTCRRCHSSLPEQDVHTQAGLACVSCHSSVNHEIQARVDCLNCHNDMPHQDPFLNVKHQRLDCRTCHVSNGVSITADVSQATKNPVTGFYGPAVEVQPDTPAFAWAKDGQEAAIDVEGAKIVPLIPARITAPASFNPVDYARTGAVNGSGAVHVAIIVPSHGVTLDNARTCDTCHGPDADFDFVSLGYSEEEADALSARPPAESE